MGVHGLWNLLEPSSKPVPLESLENKVLAVDVSIWLHQLVKGYQDSRGNALPNAHLLGLFHRICKLLFYKIKPVFVFDGDVPLLKKQTVANRQRQKGKLQDDADQVRQKLAKNILKHTAIKKVLGTKVTEHQAQLNMARLLPEPDMFELPALKPTLKEGEAAESEVDYMSSSDDDDGDDYDDHDSPCKHIHADLHSIDVKSEDFKALPAEVRHDILTELKETRKQSSWGRLHEMPEESGQFSNFQMNRLLKRRNFQVSLEEAEKEMGGRTMSLGELEEMLNDQGVMTNTNLDLGKRIASDSSTRFVYIREAAKKTLFSTTTPSVSAIKKEDDSNNSVSSGTSLPTSCPKIINVNNSKSILSPNVLIEEDEFEEDWLSESEVDKEQSEHLDKGKNTSSYDLAKGFMFVASSLTQNQIDNIVHRGHKSPQKSKRPAVNGGPNVGNHSNRTNVGTTVDESLPGTSSSSVEVINVEEELDYIGIISDESDSEIEEIEIKEKDDKKPLEIVIKPDTHYNIEEDLFADVFFNIEHDLIQKQKQIQKIAQSSRESKMDSITGDNQSKTPDLALKNIIVDVNKPTHSFTEPVAETSRKVNIKQFDRPVFKDQMGNVNRTSIPYAESEGLQEKVVHIDKNNVTHPIKAISECKEIEESIKVPLPDTTVDLLISSQDTKVEQAMKSTIVSLNDVNSRIVQDTLKIKDPTQNIESVAINIQENKEECNITAELISNISQEVRSKDNNISSSSLPVIAAKCSSGDTDAIKDVNISSELLEEQLSLKSSTIPESSLVTEDSYYSQQVELDSTSEDDDASLTQPSTLPVANKLTTVDLQGMQASLEDQHSALLMEQGKTERMAASITTQMCTEAQDLLRLFGLPYLNAPMEAEAQCAFLDYVSLTDGTISDDSDIWLFGGRKVYKNFFNQKKHVVQFTSSDIQNVLNLARNQMILLALLTGSDYTSGLTGVGPVTALEIIAAFPSGNGDNEADLAIGLRKFKEWFAQGRPAGPGTATLRNKLKDLQLVDGFPSTAVIEGYLHPTVDDSKEKFTWGKPDLSKLREYAREKFGWTRLKADEILLPVMKKLNERNTQKSLDSYFKVQVKLPAGDGKLSKRVKKAVRRIGTEETTSDVEDDPHPIKKSRRKASANKTQLQDEAKTQLKNRGGETKTGQEDSKSIEERTESKDLATNSEYIPQREKDKLNALKNKLKAIELFRTSKSGLDKTKRPKRLKRIEKAEAELSESSSD